MIKEALSYHPYIYIYKSRSCKSKIKLVQDTKSSHRHRHASLGKDIPHKVVVALDKASSEAPQKKGNEL